MGKGKTIDDYLNELKVFEAEVDKQLTSDQKNPSHSAVNETKTMLTTLKQRKLQPHYSPRDLYDEAVKLGYFDSTDKAHEALMIFVYHTYIAGLHSKADFGIMGRTEQSNISFFDWEHIRKIEQYAKCVPPAISDSMKEAFGVTNELAGGSILHSNHWTLLLNDMWILSHVEKNQPIWCVSPLSWYNLWTPPKPADGKQPYKDFLGNKIHTWETWFEYMDKDEGKQKPDHKAGRMTVTAREFIGLLAFGYTFDRHDMGVIIATRGKSRLEPTLTNYNNALNAYVRGTHHESYDYLHDKLFCDPKHRNLTIHAVTELMIENQKTGKWTMTNYASLADGKTPINEETRRLVEELRTKTEQHPEIFRRDYQYETELGTGKDAGLDFRGANLCGIRFENNNFRNYRFMVANFENTKMHMMAKFNNADLRGVNFENAKFITEATDFTGAKLELADFTGAIFEVSTEHLHFSTADVAYADFSEATIIKPKSKSSRSDIKITKTFLKDKKAINSNLAICPS